MSTALSMRRDYYPGRVAAWRNQGLSARAAAALAMAGCETVAQVRTLGREFFAGRPNIGNATLDELALLAGWPQRKATVQDAIAAALSMAIHDSEEAHEIATDITLSLRRAGFVVTAQKAARR